MKGGYLTMSLLNSFLVSQAVMKKMTSAPVKANTQSNQEKSEERKVFKFSNYDKIEQLKMYYLFMLIDGELTNSEKDNFTKLCETMEATSEEIKEVTDFCYSIIPQITDENYSNIVTIRILQILGWVENTEINLSYNKSFPIGLYATAFHSTLKISNEADCLRFVWTLINLSYSDGNCSEAEKNLIDIIAEELRIESTALLDLKDTAKTMYMLCKQKDWLKTTNKPYDDVTKELAKIDGQIEILAQNIENLISDEDIA